MGSLEVLMSFLLLMGVKILRAAFESIYWLWDFFAHIIFGPPFGLH